jgi:alanine racemase
MVPTIINLIKKQSKKIKITIFVDTGLNRTGISYDKAIEIGQMLIDNTFDISNFTEQDIESIYTTFN